MTRDEYRDLTVRERQVFERVGRGMSYKRVARELDLSIRTVETYAARLSVKLGHPHLPPMSTIRHVFQTETTTVEP